MTDHHGSILATIKSVALIYMFTASPFVVSIAEAETSAVGIWTREEKSDVSVQCALIGEGSAKLSLIIREASGKIISRRSFLSNPRTIYEIKIPASSSAREGSFEAIAQSEDLVPACQVLGVPRNPSAKSGMNYRFTNSAPQSGRLFVQTSTVDSLRTESVRRARSLVYNPSDIPVIVTLEAFDSQGAPVNLPSATLELPAKAVSVIPLQSQFGQPSLLAITPQNPSNSLSVIDVQVERRGEDSDFVNVRLGQAALCRTTSIPLPELSGSVRRLVITNTAAMPITLTLSLVDPSGNQISKFALTIAARSSHITPLDDSDDARFAKIECTYPRAATPSDGYIAYATVSSPKLSGVRKSWTFEVPTADQITAGQPAFTFLSNRPSVDSSLILWPSEKQELSCTSSTYDSSGQEVTRNDFDLVNNCISETEIESTASGILELSCSTPNSGFGSGLLERIGLGDSQVVSYSPIWGLVDYRQKPEPSTYQNRNLPQVKKLSFDGYALYRSGKYEEASVKFLQALKLAPNHRCVLGWLIDSYERRGKRSEASELVSQLLHADAKSSLGLTKQAQYLTEEGEFNKAAEILRRLVDHDPYNPAHNTNLGIALMRLGDLSDSDQAIEKALSVNPRFPLALWAKLEINEKQGNLPTVHSLEDQILSIPLPPSGRESESTFLRGARAMVLARRGSHDEAIRELKEAEKSSPSDHRVVWTLAEQLGKIKNWDAALSYARQAVTLYPRNSAYVATLGWILLEKGELQQAKDVLDTALRQGIESARMHVNLGMAYARTNDLGNAEKEFLIASKLDSNDWLGFNNLGWIAELRGDLQSAYEYYSRAVTLSNGEELARFNLTNVQKSISEIKSENQ